jgi:hypothetical protein
VKSFNVTFHLEVEATTPAHAYTKAMMLVHEDYMRNGQLPTTAAVIVSPADGHVTNWPPTIIPKSQEGPETK